jgi:hypothetical protein
MQESGTKKQSKFNETKRFLSMADYFVSTTPYVFGLNLEMVCFDSYVFEQTSLLSRDVNASLVLIDALGNMEHPFWSYIRLNYVYFWDLAIASLRALLRVWLGNLHAIPKERDLELWNKLISICSCSYKEFMKIIKLSRLTQLLGNFVFESVKMQALIKLMLYVE